MSDRPNPAIAARGGIKTTDASVIPPKNVALNDILTMSPLIALKLKAR